MLSLNAAEIAGIENNLFPFVRNYVRENPNFPWHRDSNGLPTASQTVSSQALAIDFFGTIKKLVSRDAIFTEWIRHFALHLSGPWDIELEALVPRDLLGEQRATQIDALATGSGGLIAFECKFTEPDGGACSQPNALSKGAHKGLKQCNGNYEEQVNPVNSVKSRCALSGKGIRYWEFVSEVMDVDSTQDHRRCPFTDGRYQWMRNLVAALMLGRAFKKPPVFMVVYTEGPFPMAKKLLEADWKRFIASVEGHAVPLRIASYQQLLSLASEAATENDRPVLNDLDKWIAGKVSAASAQRP